MPSEHAILGPSAAYRWLVCTPSARFEEQIPEEESEYAEEGTLAHDLAAHVLEARAGIYKGSQRNYNIKLNEIEQDVIAYYESIDNYDGANDFLTMMQHAEDWAEFVKGFGGEILIEQQYDLSRYVPVGFGTVDATNITPRVLYISDFKYGVGVLVKAKNNKQLMLYGLGALIEAHKRGYRPETVVLSIFQPRAGGSSSWEISVNDLLTWADSELASKTGLAISGRGEFIPGTHCQFCKARTSCRAYFEKFEKVLNIKDKRVMSGEDLATVLTYAPLITPWYNKIKEESVAKLERGKTIPGFKLVKGRGQRKFKSEDNVVDILLGEGYETDGIFNTSLRALTDLEKTLGPKKFGALFADEIINQEGRPQLAEASDPRPSIGASGADEYDDENDLL